MPLRWHAFLLSLSRGRHRCTSLFDSFLAAHCVASPDQSIPLKLLTSLLLQAIPAADRPAWGRGRVISELSRRGYEIGVIDRRAAVIGLSLASSEVPA